MNCNKALARYCKLPDTSFEKKLDEHAPPAAQQQVESLLQSQQAGDWSHGHPPQVADSLVCDTPVPIRVVQLNPPVGNPPWLQEVQTGAAPAVAETRLAPNGEGKWLHLRGRQEGQTRAAPEAVP
jgi:hypothetical protein